MIDADLIASLKEGGDPAVSLYFPVAPDQRPKAGPQAQMRAVLERADAALQRHGLDGPAREALLAPARGEAGESGFAHHRDHGFALFMAPGQEPRRVVLPAPMGDAVLVVGQRFHIKPLLAHAARERRFHVLALTAGDARLFAATPQDWQEVPLDLLRKEHEAEAMALEEAGPPGAVPGPAPRREVAGNQLRHALVVEDLHRVAFAVQKALATDTSPVLLAGEPEAVGHFRGLARLPNLQDDALLLNPFAFPQAELHARATAHMQPMLDEPLQRALEQVRARLGTAEATVGIRPEEILAAAHDGRVDTVIVAEDSDLWGRYEPPGPDASPAATPTLVVHGRQVDAEEELLNEAVVEALRTGARVFAAPMAQLPRQSPAVALYRY